MNHPLDAAAVKDHARAAGADLAGIAPAERFADLDCRENPASILPAMRTAIVLGFRVLRGGLRGMESGSCWNAFSAGSPFAVMVESTYNFCRVLENAGHETVPLNHMSADLRGQGVAVAPDKPAPDVIVDMDYMAYAAGLGTVGRGKLFLTPEFGPRQNFTAVLTTLPLAPDPVRDDDPCGACRACLDACPARAFSPERDGKKEGACGTLAWHARLVESCRICRTGATANPYGTPHDPNRLGAACGRACVAALEAVPGRLSGGLDRPFREARA